MRAPMQTLVIAWSVAVGACTPYHAYVREADVAAMNRPVAEAESLCPAPPRAIGGGPTQSPPTGTISLGTVTAPEDGSRSRSTPNAMPRPNAAGSNGSAYPSWWNTPPPVVIEDGPSPTIGPGGSGFTIRPGY